MVKSVCLALTPLNVNPRSAINQHRESGQVIYPLGVQRFHL